MFLMVNAHVFVVDRDSYPVHRDRLFCGVKNPPRINARGIPNPSHYGLIADLKAIRKGDLVFFYQMRRNEEKHLRGFRGVFQVISDSFFSDEDIDGVNNSFGDLGSFNKKVLGKCPFCGTSISDKTKDVKKMINGKKRKVTIKYCLKCGKELMFHILPNRVLIKPLVYYDNPIDDNTAYIDRDFIKKKGMLWTMLFRKTFGAGRERSITHILPEEAEKLLFMFKTLFKEKELDTFTPYKPKNAQPIKIPLDTNDKGEVIIEAYLEAWIMENIDKNIPILRDVIGPVEEIEYFGNNVLYGIGGEKVDVLVLHKRGDERYKATVMELKKGKLKESDVKQIKDYTKWMAQLAFGDSTKDSKQKIQPTLIGFDTPQKIINFAKKFITETQPIIILNYRVEGNTLKFERVL